MLSEAVGTSAILLAKVRLGDLVRVRGQGSEEATARNKIDRKHVDFVLVDPGSMQPWLVIELDDRSHRSAAARSRDADKDAALAGAGLPLLRIPAARRYDAGELRQQIAGMRTR